MDVRNVTPKRRDELIRQSAGIRTAHDFRQFAELVLGMGGETLADASLTAANNVTPVSDETVLTADLVNRAAAWLGSSANVIDLIDEYIGDHGKSPRQSTELIIALQAIAQRLGK